MKKPCSQSKWSDINQTMSLSHWKHSLLNLPSQWFLIILRINSVPYCGLHGSLGSTPAYCCEVICYHCFLLCFSPTGFLSEFLCIRSLFLPQGLCTCCFLYGQYSISNYLWMTSSFNSGLISNDIPQRVLLWLHYVRKQHPLYWFPCSNFFLSYNYLNIFLLIFLFDGCLPTCLSSALSQCPLPLPTKM